MDVGRDCFEDEPTLPFSGKAYDEICMNLQQHAASVEESVASCS